MFKPSVRRRRMLLVTASLVLLYAAALVAWTRGPSTRHASAPNPGTSQPPAPVVSAASSGMVGKPAERSGTTATSNPPGAFLPALPQSALLNTAGAPRHSVVLASSSDGNILRLGYVVADGRAKRGAATNVASPVRIVTEGIGYGLLANFAAQAAPDANYITCSVTVDGRVRVQHRASGGWAVVDCVG